MLIVSCPRKAGTLVSCPEIRGILPEVSWLFFKARAKRPYLSHTGRASNAEKQPTGPGPKGCDENGPAAALLVGHVSVQICSLLAPCRRPILIATKYLVFRGQDTSDRLPVLVGSVGSLALAPDSSLVVVDSRPSSLSHRRPVQSSWWSAVRVDSRRTDSYRPAAD